MLGAKETLSGREVFLCENEDLNTQYLYKKAAMTAQAITPGQWRVRPGGSGARGTQA